MRILNLVHQYLPDRIGGVERYTQSIAHALRKRGHEVGIFYRRSAQGAGVEGRDDQGVTVWAVASGQVTPSRRFLAVFGNALIEHAFARVLDAYHPELVHVQHLMGLPVRLLDMVSDRRIPMVITLHDYWWICANAQLVRNYDQQLCGGPDRLRLNCARCALARSNRGALWPAIPGLALVVAARERLLRRGLAGAMQIIAPTEFVRSWYVSHGLAARCIHTLPHGIEPPPQPAAAIQPGAGTGRSELDPVRFAYLGGLAWQKGVHVLVAAFNRLGGGAELWIAGDETAEPGYVRGLKESAGPAVRFLGALSRAQVWDILRQVDVVAVPSLWYETFSLIVHEAFAAGRPVVASRHGALAEVVRDGVDGLLVTPGDVDAWHRTLLRLCESPDLRLRLQAGIRRPLTLEEHVGRLDDIYAGAVRAAGTRGWKPPG